MKEVHIVIGTAAIAVNAAAPSNPVATPGAGTLDLAKTDTEDIELITQTALTLCTGDPKSMTGRIASALYAERAPLQQLTLPMLDCALR